MPRKVQERPNCWVSLRVRAAGPRWGRRHRGRGASLSGCKDLLQGSPPGPTVPQPPPDQVLVDTVAGGQIRSVVTRLWEPRIPVGRRW